MGRWVVGFAAVVFAAASVWLTLLIPKSGFAAPPPGSLVSRDELLAQVDRGQVASILVTSDPYDDIVARTTSGSLLVYRVSAAQTNSFASDPQAFIEDVESRGRADLFAQGKRDTTLTAYGRSVAQLPPADPTIPELAWFASLIGGLSVVMYMAAGRTDFRFSLPFGDRLGVGTDPSPNAKSASKGPPS